MRIALGCALVLVFALDASAYDVTTSQGRKLNLLEYIATRTDLSADQRAEWHQRIRLTFGGKALKDGTDEGVTVAKSVISGAIFFGVDAKSGARAAYDAYHDSYRWVPPPLAISYQLLVLRGRKPKVSSRRLAFKFPRYFNEDLAPDLVAWWEEMLRKGAISELEAPDVRRILHETRGLMRPMMRDMLWRGVELETQLAAQPSMSAADRANIKDALKELKRELQRAFSNVSHQKKVNRPGPFYERYRLLCQELGDRPRAQPAVPKTRVKPKARRAKPAKKPAARKPPKPARPPAAGMVERKQALAEERRRGANGRVRAPLPGSPLVEPYTGWPRNLQRHVDGWVGVPYLWGGTTRSGVDCSAFVREVYRDSLNIELPRNSRAQYSTGRKIKQRDLKVGDLVFFDTLDRGRVTHVGVYLGNNEFAHASSSRGVTPAQLKKRYYQRAYWGARRLLRH